MFFKKENKKLSLLFERGINNSGHVYCKISNVDPTIGNSIFMYHDPDYWLFTPLHEIEIEIKRILSNFRKLVKYEKLEIELE